MGKRSDDRGERSGQPDTRTCPHTHRAHVSSSSSRSWNSPRSAPLDSPRGTSPPSPGMSPAPCPESPGQRSWGPGTWKCTQGPGRQCGTRRSTSSSTGSTPAAPGGSSCRAPRLRGRAPRSRPRGSAGPPPCRLDWKCAECARNTKLGRSARTWEDLCYVFLQAACCLAKCTENLIPFCEHKRMAGRSH